MDGESCALREFREETGHDISSEISSLTLVSSGITPTERTVDHGWLEAWQYATVVENCFELTPGDDADDVSHAEWKDFDSLDSMVEQGQLSRKKLAYIHASAKLLGLTA
jgi:8-oxo-dGTP pyrophosphatase MutT (NUDIX family)